MKRKKRTREDIGSRQKCSLDSITKVLNPGSEQESLLDSLLLWFFASCLNLCLLHWTFVVLIRVVLRSCSASFFFSRLCLWAFFLSSFFSLETFSFLFLVFFSSYSFKGISCPHRCPPAVRLCVSLLRPPLVCFSTKLSSVSNRPVSQIFISVDSSRPPPSLCTRGGSKSDVTRSVHQPAVRARLKRVVFHTWAASRRWRTRLECQNSVNILAGRNAEGSRPSRDWLKESTFSMLSHSCPFLLTIFSFYIGLYSYYPLFSFTCLLSYTCQL